MGETFANDKIQTMKGHKNFHHIQNIFETVAGEYEWMNYILSAGQQDRWRRYFVEKLPFMVEKSDPQDTPHGQEDPVWVYIDMACGSGEIGKGVLERLQNERFGQSPPPSLSETKASILQGISPRVTRKLFFCDPNPAMQKEGKKRLFHQSAQDEIHWVCCRGEKVPFKDCSVDLYTTAFGMRNMVHLQHALKEAWRVLKPGGWFYCLELSMPKDPMVHAVYDRLLNVVPWVGQAVVGHKQPYQYLADSIRQFPLPDAFQGLLKETGFQTIPYTPLSLGILTIFGGQKCTSVR